MCRHRIRASKLEKTMCLSSMQIHWGSHAVGMAASLPRQTKIESHGFCWPRQVPGEATCQSRQTREVNHLGALMTCHRKKSPPSRALTGAPQVVDHAWGEDVSVLGRPPDVITGADVIYEEQHYPALLATLGQLAAPHTLILLAFRLRGETGVNEGRPCLLKWYAGLCGVAADAGRLPAVAHSRGYWR